MRRPCIALTCIKKCTDTKMFRCGSRKLQHSRIRRIADSGDSISIYRAKLRFSRHPASAFETAGLVETVHEGTATYTTALIRGRAFKISSASVTTFSGTKCAYTIVILISECPNRTASFCRLIPFCTILLANECLSTCQDTRHPVLFTITGSFNPAASAALRSGIIEYVLSPRLPGNT